MADCDYPKLAALVEYLDGLTGRADLTVLDSMLRTLDVQRADIEAACTFGSKGYKRNTIKRTAHYELLALCWRSGDCTPIHDHRGVSCAFRVVHGTGTEIRFVPTPAGLICPSETTPMPPGYICSAEDHDIHQVANMQPPGSDLITLHIYSPPISRMTTYDFASPKLENIPQYAGVTEDRQLVGAGAGI
ncbi:MAG: cysteine dioxygenase [Phycisphaerales bacterium]